MKAKALLSALALVLSAMALQTMAPGVVTAEPAAGERTPGAALGTIEVLDAAADFSFAIMSDHKGESASSPAFAKMVQWIERSGDRFVVGLGDHVKIGWENSFLEFLKANRWWHDNLYPNVADGENEYYGKGQDDWGAGAPILDAVTLGTRPGVAVRENRCEYYAKLSVEGYIVHLIQLHYADSPDDDLVAFNPDTRAYLMDTLRQIDKGPRDIVVVGAHSRTGFWAHLLSQEQRRVLMEKADLVLSATTHRFGRGMVEGYEDHGALCINTGSVTFPSTFCPQGYVQVHVLRKPRWLVVQYIDLTEDAREAQPPGYAFVKEMGGKVFAVRFREPRPDEDLDRVICSLPKAYSREEMDAIVKQNCAAATGADEALCQARTGLDGGEVTLRDLWSAVGWNDEMPVLTLKAEEIERTLPGRLPVGGRAQIKVAMPAGQAGKLIAVLRLPGERVARTSKRPVDLLRDWVVAECSRSQ